MSMKKEMATLVKSAEQYKGRTDLTEEEAAAAIDLAEQITALREKMKVADEAAEKLNGVFTIEGAHDEDAEASTDAEDVKGASIGARFVKSDAMRAFRKANPHGLNEKEAGRAFGVKATVAKKDATVISRPTAGLPLVVTDPTIVNPFEQGRKLSILDLITKGTTDAQAMKYRQVTKLTNGAALVPESLDDTSEKYLKPLSDIAIGESAIAVDSTYADGVVVTTQEWNDDGALQALIDSTLTRNIELLTEDMILNGSGVDGNPLGILNADGLNEQAFDTDILRTVRRARGILDAGGYTASALVVSPNDAVEIDLLQASNGAYYGGGPVTAGVTPSLWGVPIVVSPKMKDGEALMGDWSTIHLLTLDPLNINVFDQHLDYARRNLIYLRAEYRALQLLRAPASFVKVQLGN